MPRDLALRGAGGKRGLGHPPVLMTRHSDERQVKEPLYVSILFLLVSAAPLWAQGKKAQSFVLNPAKPYAYIEFDRAGKRTPLGPDESKYGYWLRLVNNSRLPIAVVIFPENSGNRGLVLFDEVVPISQGGGVVSFPPLPVKPRTECPVPTAKPPEGYSNETSSYTDIEPGKSLLFSIPSNQLSRAWFIRVKFWLDVEEDPFSQPYSYVDFDWWHLPEAVRRLCK